MQQNSLPQNLRHPLPILLGGLLLLLVIFFIVSTVVVALPMSVTQQIVLLMAGTGAFFTVSSYGLYRSGVLRYLGSLRWLLLLIVVFTVLVVLFQLWVLSSLMIFSTHYLPIVTTMMFFAGLTGISFGYFVSRAMTERLFKLSEAAGRLAQGDLSTRLEVIGNDEIALLTRSFNAMAHDLQQVDEQKRMLEQTRRDLVAWVSHDLRTPLTSMRVMLEALSDGVVQDEETQQRYMQTSLAEIEHLSRLIDDLFQLAQLDVGHTQLDFQLMSIGDLISDTLGGMMAKAQRKDIRLHGEVEDGIHLVKMAPDKIQRVLKNLADNAIKYTPAGESVTIRACRRDLQTIQIDVHNTGVHIPQNVLPNLFESFYRGESSRATTDDERGAGLGLAIARGFVQAHGGEIWAESDPASGTTFSFTLPENH